MPRAIVWFSCGAASAVAAKLAAIDPPDGLPVELVYCDTGGEHEDNVRFCRDVSRWVGLPVLSIRNPTYRDHYHVAERDRYINGPTGARCTRQLKRLPRERYQRPGDLHIWGFDSTEQERADDFEERNPDLKCHFPLIEAGLTKDDCFHLIKRAGIELPMMYKLGYRNNNCIGCWKGGMGYWNKIRRDFPERFAEAARICREVGASPIKMNGKPLFLDELDPAAGRYDTEPDPICGIMCQLTQIGIERAASGGCSM
jgi:hypothetical protein